MYYVRAWLTVQRLYILQSFRFRVCPKVCMSLRWRYVHLLSSFSLIRSGSAIPFTAHANPPSLTISCIKAMTIGSNPSFLDVALNIADNDDASNLSSEDTWLSRFKSTIRGKIVFYGENTWLQLYPDIFDRSEGVDAFFVPDFTEVDNNVTIHVSPQLAREDWSALVFHFPGMDHIGHTGGPERLV